MLGSLQALQGLADPLQRLLLRKPSFAQNKDVVLATNASQQQLVGILMLKLFALKDSQ
jgi:hypothetical protein